MMSPAGVARACLYAAASGGSSTLRPTRPERKAGVLWACPEQDRIALSRPGIREFSETLAHDFGADAPPPEKLYQQALYFTALHEIGHWLGLGHVPDGEKSIMVASPLQAFLGEGKYNRLWMVDKRLACLKNDCGDDWCSKIKQ